MIALAETIQEVGAVERAALFAAFSAVLPLAEFDKALAELQKAGLISITGDLIQWMK